MKNIPYLVIEAKPRQYLISVNSASLLNVMCDFLGAGEDHLT